MSIGNLFYGHLLQHPPIFLQSHLKALVLSIFFIQNYISGLPCNHPFKNMPIFLQVKITRC